MLLHSTLYLMEKSKLLQHLWKSSKNSQTSEYNIAYSYKNRHSISRSLFVVQFNTSCHHFFSKLSCMMQKLSKIDIFLVSVCITFSCNIVNDTHRERLVFHSLQYRNGWLAAADLFDMFTQSIKFYTLHYQYRCFKI